MKKIERIILLLTLIFIVAFFILLPKFVVIKNISCSSQYGPCLEDIVKKLEGFQEGKLSKVKKELKSYLKSEPEVKDFSFQYKIPDRIIVNIIERKAEFAVKSLDKNIFVFIDSGGKAIAIKESSPLPYIEVNGYTPNVGEIVNDSVFAALNLIKSIYSQYQVTSGKMEINDLYVNFPEGISVIFPLDKDRDILMGSLKLIFNRLNSSLPESRIIEGKKISIIDLRFTNPVLR